VLRSDRKPRVSVRDLNRLNKLNSVFFRVVFASRFSDGSRIAASLADSDAVAHRYRRNVRSARGSAEGCPMRRSFRVRRQPQYASIAIWELRNLRRCPHDPDTKSMPFLDRADSRFSMPAKRPKNASLYVSHIRSLKMIVDPIYTDSTPVLGCSSAWCSHNQIGKKTKRRDAEMLRNRKQMKMPASSISALSSSASLHLCVSARSPFDVRHVRAYLSTHL
jgi:hypothetical protein